MQSFLSHCGSPWLRGQLGLGLLNGDKGRQSLRSLLLLSVIEERNGNLFPYPSLVFKSFPASLLPSLSKQGIRRYDYYSRLSLSRMKVAFLLAKARSPNRVVNYLNSILYMLTWLKYVNMHSKLLNEKGK